VPNGWEHAAELSVAVQDVQRVARSPEGEAGLRLTVPTFPLGHQRQVRTLGFPAGSAQGFGDNRRISRGTAPLFTPEDGAFHLESYTYVRRFDQEHTVRFCTQILTRTTPRVRDPEQADRWTWLVLLAYTHLRLARSVVADQRLPWERRLDARPLTPYRVRRAFCAALPLLGTPAKPPKPCGRSPGRPTGARSGPAPRYPAIKTAA
jgi:hypothetical protein